MSYWKVILIWFCSVLGIGVVLAVLRESNSHGGEQKLLTTLVYTYIIDTAGVLLLVLASIFTRFQWFKRYIVANILIIVLCLVQLYPIMKYWTTPSYASISESFTLNNNSWEITTEYYDNSHERIRSVSFFKNTLKDSVWTTFSKTGEIISKTMYKNGKEVR